MTTSESDARRRMDEFETRSRSAAEAVRELRRGGHLLRLHSADHVMDDRGAKVWGEFLREYFPCILGRATSPGDLVACGFLVGVEAANRQRVLSLSAQPDDRYRHFR